MIYCNTVCLSDGQEWRFHSIHIWHVYTGLPLWQICRQVGNHYLCHFIVSLTPWVNRLQTYTTRLGADTNRILHGWTSFSLNTFSSHTLWYPSSIAGKLESKLYQDWSPIRNGLTVTSLMRNASLHDIFVLFIYTSLPISTTSAPTQVHFPDSRQTYTWMYRHIPWTIILFCIFAFNGESVKPDHLGDKEYIDG